MMQRRAILAGAGTVAGAATVGRGQAQPASGKPIRIGVLNDMSGVYSDYQGRGSVLAAEFAAADAGRINGAPVSVVFGDHQNKPDIGASVARRWLDTEGVDMILDVPNSAIALAVADLCRQKNRVFIGSGAGTADLTGAKCSPNTVHWTYDTWSIGHSLGKAVVARGGKRWFILTADYAFGFALEEDTARYVKSKGGKVVGAVRHPLSASDFSSFLLQAQGSKAKIIGLANAGLDTSNAIKSASEFGIVQGAEQLAALLFTVAEVHGLGLKSAQGLVLTEGYYWDLDDQSRPFAKRFQQRTGRMPNMVHAGTYSAVSHYLKAIQAAGTDETDAVVRKMKEMPVDDFFARKGKVQENGRMVHDMYLFQVKKPEESKGPWDYYKHLATIPGDQAFASVQESGCVLTQ